MHRRLRSRSKSGNPKTESSSEPVFLDLSSYESDDRENKRERKQVREEAPNQVGKQVRRENEAEESEREKQKLKEGKNEKQKTPAGKSQEKGKKLEKEKKQEEDKSEEQEEDKSKKQKEDKSEEQEEDKSKKQKADKSEEQDGEPVGLDVRTPRAKKGTAVSKAKKAKKRITVSSNASKRGGTGKRKREEGSSGNLGSSKVKADDNKSKQSVKRTRYDPNAPSSTEKDKTIYRDAAKATYHAAERVWEKKGKEGIVVVVKKDKKFMAIVPFWSKIHLPCPGQNTKLEIRIGGRRYEVDFKLQLMEGGKHQHQISGEGWISFLNENDLVFQDCVLFVNETESVLRAEVFRKANHGTK